MHYLCLTCEALTRPVYLGAALSRHSIDIELVRIGLHDRPKELRARLQERIDAATDEKYAAVLLAYGLCGQSTAGLIANNLPLVMPRAHDCITLFLGSRKRYQQEFESNPGTYWYSQDYIERRDGDTLALAMGSGMVDDVRSVYDEYVEKYGQDNADYLMEVMGAWKSHYNRAAFIDLGIADASAVEATAQSEAQRRGWTYERLQGDTGLMRRLLAGDWDDDFLIIPPGHRIIMTGDDGVIGCKPAVE
jgi:hypothetical protein